MRAYCLFLVLFFSVATSAHAQEKSNSPLLPLSAGIFGGLGFDVSSKDSQFLAGADGVYVESLRYRFHPGLEIRGAAADGIRGTLTGPRVSVFAGRPSDGVVSFYAAALFGPQHYELYSAGAPNQLITQDIQGVTSEGVIGMDLFSAAHPHTGWRVEYSQGTYTGAAGSRPRALLLGVVFRLP